LKRARSSLKKSKGVKKKKTGWKLTEGKGMRRGARQKKGSVKRGNGVPFHVG